MGVGVGSIESVDCMEMYEAVRIIPARARMKSLVLMYVGP